MGKLDKLVFLHVWLKTLPWYLPSEGHQRSSGLFRQVAMIRASSCLHESLQLHIPDSKGSLRLHQNSPKMLRGFLFKTKYIGRDCHCYQHDTASQSLGSIQIDIVLDAAFFFTFSCRH